MPGLLVTEARGGPAEAGDAEKDGEGGDTIASAGTC